MNDIGSLLTGILNADDRNGLNSNELIRKWRFCELI